MAGSATFDPPRAATAQPSSSDKFSRYFQHQVTDVQEQMARIRQQSTTGGERADAIDHCLSGIARLSSAVQDASADMPAHDQRTYADAIQALHRQLHHVRASSAARPRFAFKSTSASVFSPAKNESAISLEDAADMAAAQKRRQSSPAPSDAPDASRRPTTPAESTALSITQHQDLHIVLPPAARHAATGGTLSNLERCVVDLSRPAADAPWAQLMLKNITSSLLICGHVRGAAHVTNVKDSVIVVASRQFRMHECSNCHVYVLVASRPIIERCASIRFAPLPRAYMRDGDHALANQWSAVDDFQWLRREPSPHWCPLPPAQRIPDHSWRDLAPPRPSASPHHVLRALGVPPAE